MEQPLEEFFPNLGQTESYEVTNNINPKKGFVHYFFQGAGVGGRPLNKKILAGVELSVLNTPGRRLYVCPNFRKYRYISAEVRRQGCSERTLVRH